MRNKRLWKALLIILLFVIAGTVYSCRYSSLRKALPEAETSLILPAEEAQDTTEETQTGDTTAQLCIYICGCVKNPGVYYLAADSRVIDAVEEAGGFTGEACAEAVNLAAPAADGERIYIPSEQEAEEAGLLDGVPGTGQEGSDLVNINTADAAELMTLPGIGEVRAQAIIAYRNENGPFRSIEEIQNVTGIKSGSFEKIKDFIRV